MPMRRPRGDLPAPTDARGVILGFAIGLGACAIWGVLLTLSARKPTDGPWPPRKGNIGTALWAWGLTIAIYVGLFQVWQVPQGAWAWLVWIVALGIGFAGSALQTWGMVNLRLNGTSGWDVGVVTDGAYRYCRHPQYLGQAAGFFGFAILINSVPGWIIAGAAIGTLAAAAWVEDKALRARHPEFADYAARTAFLWGPARP